MDANQRQARDIRRLCRQMMALADELDPPIVPAKASPVARLICPDCGTEYHGPEYRHGDPCLTVRCEGLICRKSDMAKPQAIRTAREYSASVFEDGPLTTTDGRDLGVTLGELAYQQAVRDFVVGGTDELPDMDIASTYGGRS